MAVSLGKRKRLPDTVASTTETGRTNQKSALRDQSNSSDDDDDDDENRAKALFQRAFEAKFQPLEQITGQVRQGEISSEEDTGFEEDITTEVETSDWGGLSDTAQDEVEVIEFAHTTRPSEEDRRRRRKGFMSSKPPSSLDELPGGSVKSSIKTEESQQDGSEAVNLKHDLALQRLLKESHLLDPANFDKSSLEPQGKTRLKALDMRIRDLGAKKSMLQQDKMPMSHRKGIIAKASDREATRRREAAENGIVLERARKNGKSSTQRRTRGVGDPTIGKFKGGTLSLSSRDVRSIEGQGVGGPGRKKGRR